MNRFTARATFATLVISAASGASAAQISADKLGAGEFFLSSTCSGYNNGSFAIAIPGLLQPMNTSVSSSGPSAHEPASKCDSSASAAATSSTTGWRFDTSANGAPTTQAGSATGVAARGVARVKAQVTGTMAADISAGKLWSGAVAGWRDGMTIKANDPSLDGKQGRLFFKMHIDGTLDAHDEGTEAGFLVQTWRDGAPTSFASSAALRDFNAVIDATRAAPDVHQVIDKDATIGFTFIFGQKFDLGVYALAYVLANGNPSLVDGTADFSHTMRWDGIQSVRAVSNGSIVDYTLTSDSGFDWRGPVPAAAAVPEPQSGALFLAGLAAAGLMLRRKARPAKR